MSAVSVRRWIKPKSSSLPSMRNWCIRLSVLVLRLFPEKGSLPTMRFPCAAGEAPQSSSEVGELFFASRQTCRALSFMPDTVAPVRTSWSISAEQAAKYLVISSTSIRYTMPPAAADWCHRRKLKQGCFIQYIVVIACNDLRSASLRCAILGWGRRSNSDICSESALLQQELALVHIALQMQQPCPTR